MLARLTAILLATAAAAAHAAPPDCEALAIAAVQAGGDRAARSKAWTAAGNCFFDADDPRRAIETYEYALALAPDQPDVLSDQAVMFHRLKDPAKAIEKLERAVAVQPRHLNAWFNLGVVHHEAGDTERAGAAWRKVVALAPESQQAKTARGQLIALDDDVDDEAVEADEGERVPRGRR